jgi:transcriptional regulator of acetoin/glycerol metabolism
VLARHDGRVGLAAATLGISRKTLWEKCRRHGLRTLE